MRRCSLTVRCGRAASRRVALRARGRRTGLAIGLTFVVSLVVATSGAQAVVVNDQGNHAGVALVPGGSLPAGMAVASSGSCSDPWLSADLSYPPNGNPLCYRGGPVMHGNETFALTWDQHRLYWQTTRNYLEQFLRDVADGSNTLTSPYAVTPQYNDAGGRAGNASLYGGGCVDYGSVGGSTCQFGNTNGTGPGNDYRPNGCTASGSNQYCLTDAQLQQYELKQTIPQMGLNGHIKPGYTPLVVLLMPQGVEVCLDSVGTLCSANGSATSQFCSYHSQVSVPGMGKVAYVVQPWTEYTACDEAKLPTLPPNPTPQQLAVDAGVRIVSPLSQGQIAAITNPGLTGWVANDGSEVNANDGCGPGVYPFDNVTVGSSPQNPYPLHREFSNAGIIQSDPNTYFGCAPGVLLAPTFVVPSAVNQGDVVQLDGSTTVSSLIVPRANYAWSFGDGTTAVGPSVVHSYAAGGSYSVKLTVTDRGGNVASLSQTLNVLGPTGQPVSPPTTRSTGNPGPNAPSPGLHVRLQLMPQGLRAVVRAGVVVRVSSNKRADGIATLSISRSAAKRAHIKVGRGPSVVIGLGTVSGIKDGTVSLHLRLSRVMAAKLGRLGHLTLTVRLALVASGGDHVAIDAAGRY